MTSTPPPPLLQSFPPSGGGNGGLRSLTYNHNNNVLATSYGNTIELLHSGSGVSLETINNAPPQPSSEVVTSIAFGGKSRYLVAGSSSGSTCVWDLKRKRKVRLFVRPRDRDRDSGGIGMGNGVKGCNFDPSDSSVVVGYEDGLIASYDVKSGEFECSYGDSDSDYSNTDTSTNKPGVSSSGINFSPINKTDFALGSTDGTLSIFNYSRSNSRNSRNSPQTVFRSLHTPGPHSVAAVEWSPVNRLLLASAGGHDGNLSFLDGVSGRVIKVVNAVAGGEGARDISFHHDGVSVLVGGGDGSVSFYDLRRAEKPIWKRDLTESESGVRRERGSSGSSGSVEVRHVSWQRKYKSASANVNANANANGSSISTSTTAQSTSMLADASSANSLSTAASSPGRKKNITTPKKSTTKQATKLTTKSTMMQTNTNTASNKREKTVISAGNNDTYEGSRSLVFTGDLVGGTERVTTENENENEQAPLSSESVGGGVGSLRDRFNARKSKSSAAKTTKTSTVAGIAMQSVATEEEGEKDDEEEVIVVEQFGTENANDGVQISNLDDQEEAEDNTDLGNHSNIGNHGNLVDVFNRGFRNDIDQSNKRDLLPDSAASFNSAEHYAQTPPRRDFHENSINQFESDFRALGTKEREKEKGQGGADESLCHSEFEISPSISHSRPPPPTKDTPSPKATTQQPSIVTQKEPTLTPEILHSAVDSLRLDLLSQFHSLHTSMVRQFSDQMEEVENVVRQVKEEVRGIGEENRKLREENERLRGIY